MAKVYDLVKRILIRDEQARNSDKELIWQVYKEIGVVKEVEWFGTREAVIKENFLSGELPSFETIRRTRQKIQETELKATSKSVIEARKQKQDTKGNFIYREELTSEIWD